MFQILIVAGKNVASSSVLSVIQERDELVNLIKDISSMPNPVNRFLLFYGASEEQKRSKDQHGESQTKANKRSNFLSPGHRGALSFINRFLTNFKIIDSALDSGEAKNLPIARRAYRMFFLQIEIQSFSLLYGLGADFVHSRPTAG
jgi:hypothetical protein